MADLWLETRTSLLVRLRHHTDAASWDEFVDAYGRIIHVLALKAGLSPEDAEDATQDTLGHLIDKKIYDEFCNEMVALWQPSNAYVARRVNQLVATLWDIDRHLAVRREYLADAFTGTATTVIDMELLLSSKGDIINRLDVRLRRLNLEVSRLETDVLRLKKHFATTGPSQDSLKTNDEPETTPQTAAAPPPETSNAVPEPPAPATNNPEFPPPTAEIRPIM